ncbi:hypothetical protein E3N88_12361 [Mikania micrantha]|uniref:Myb/SANT-like domain-containing protein n=1 Tax=Mikania micrantha TaxID=192012 RepID=A0A5N6P5M3_9ASTR|nr:hypothetical protein E3N88_12361 [Mikania micrantha]
MGEKQQWSNEHIKCLLETCIEEINNVGKKGLSLNKDSWNKLEIVIKDKFGLVLTKKQMKNAFDNLTLGLGAYEAGSLKTIPLSFPDLCAALFNSNSATGSFKWTSTKTTSMVGSSSCHRVQQLLIADSIFQDTEDDADTSHRTSEPTPDPTYDPTFEPTHDPTFEATREPTTPDSNPSKRSKTSKSSSINSDDLAHDMKQALQIHMHLSRFHHLVWL